MLTEDYIMRMINQAMAALLMIIGLKQAGQYERAQQAIDHELEGLLGMKADLIRRMDDEALLRALTLNEQLDVVRLEIIADLFREQGEIEVAQGRISESNESFRRALMGYLEVRLESKTFDTNDMLDQKINGLLPTLGQESLSEDMLWGLFCYAEQKRDYTQAEQMLDELAARPGVFADLQPEIIAFYERLLSLPRQDLERKGLSLEQVTAKLAKVRAL